MKYSYGDRFSAYSVRRSTGSACFVVSILVALPAGRFAPRTLRGGEFDWGGTSVK